MPASEPPDPRPALPWRVPMPAPLRAEVEHAWSAYLDACAEAGVAPADNPALLIELTQVWAASRFVADSCRRDPALLAALDDSGDLARRYGDNELAQRCREAVAVAAVDDDRALSVALRRLRRREMVRIAWRDLSGHADLGETLGDLSALADGCVASALDLLHGWQAAQSGAPRTADGVEQRMVVLGMGKLGAHELNFSSDIDLIFAYPEYSDVGCRIGCERYFQRLGQRLIQALDEVTAEGFVFRVDLRLRPYGSSGPLAMSFDAIEEYYQSQGREWERYALIKARPLTGDPAEGRRLIEILRPFVYRRYVDFGVFESLREMKALINREIRTKGLEHNLKLGRGGIREIEFIGQALQLVRGGREPALRQRGIVVVLAELGRLGALPADAADELATCYAFLRRAENRVQACEDRQTHTLPADETGRLRLAVAMGYPDWEAFAAELGRVTERVHGHYQGLFAAPRDEDDDGGASELAAVWLGTLEGESAIAVLKAAGFAEAVKTLRLLHDLRDSRACRNQSAVGQKRLERMMPLLLAAVGRVETPRICLARLIPLVETISRRSAYIALLVENPMALSQLVRLTSASSWIAHQLILHPLLLDELLDPRSLFLPPGRDELENVLDARLAGIADDDLEQVMEVLRHFRLTSMLRVAAADVVDAIPLMVVSDHLTWLAEVILERVHDTAWAAMVARHGTPRCTIDGVERAAGIGIIAYGKLGGIELGYGSDLDLVFLHDSAGERQFTDGERSVDNGIFFARLAQRMIHMMTTLTASGTLYEIDTRLRPSGASGLMVSGLEGFAAYQREEAWTWEQQALVRARAVAGSRAVAVRFAEVRTEILARPRDTARLRQEVAEMRRKMREQLVAEEPGRFDLKQQVGGIADIEFLVQYGALAWSHEHPSILAWSDNIRLLDTMQAEGLIAPADAELLRDAYRAYRAAVHRCALREEPARVDEARFADYRDGVRAIWERILGA